MCPSGTAKRRVDGGALPSYQHLLENIVFTSYALKDRLRLRVVLSTIFNNPKRRRIMSEIKMTSLKKCSTENKSTAIEWGFIPVGKFSDWVAVYGLCSHIINSYWYFQLFSKLVICNTKWQDSCIYTKNNWKQKKHRLVVVIQTFTILLCLN